MLTTHKLREELPEWQSASTEECCNSGSCALSVVVFLPASTFLSLFIIINHLNILLHIFFLNLSPIFQLSKCFSSSLFHFIIRLILNCLHDNNIQKKQNMIDSQSNVKGMITQKVYEQLPQIKINFRFLHIYIKEADKVNYTVDGRTKLLEIKKRIDELTKKNFIFFLRESFIPSLDSKVGDIALCYGRKEGEGLYQITLTASENPQEYG